MEGEEEKKRAEIELGREKMASLDVMQLGPAYAILKSVEDSNGRGDRSSQSERVLRRTPRTRGTTRARPANVVSGSIINFFPPLSRFPSLSFGVDVCWDFMRRCPVPASASLCGHTTPHHNTRTLSIRIESIVRLPGSCCKATLVLRTLPARPLDPS